ncbi:MAG TPA: fibronectin type III domain-containing protein [Trueperaceae bacterium]
MKRFLIAALLCLCVLPAWAQPSEEPTLDVTLTWTAPTQNTDGSPLTDLVGYRIYYGTSEGGPYPNVVSVMDAGATQYIVTGETLSENTTYCFVATAVNAAGLESQYSNEACATTPDIPEVPNPPSGVSVTITLNFGGQ